MTHKTVPISTRFRIDRDRDSTLLFITWAFEPPRRAERRAFLQYQKPSAEIERRARVLCAYQWMYHHAKVARKEAQKVDQARREKRTSDARGWCRGEESG